MDVAALGALSVAIQEVTSLDQANACLAQALHGAFSAAHPTQQIMRQTLHMRDARGYADLTCFSWVDESIEDVDLTTSTALWDTINEHKTPCLLDVTLGQVSVIHSTGAAAEALSGRPLSDATTDRFRERAATHIIAWPLSEHSGALRGMVCLEIHCPAAIGDNSPWVTSTRASQPAVGVCALPILAVSAARPDSDEANEYAAVPYLRAFAAQGETLLITGATGTGKSRLAKHVHELSAQTGPFVTYSVIGLAPEMQLAHLTGWKRGAFTGANDANEGLVTAASGGTLFIDEIDKLGNEAQAGLLQLLEERTYLRLGENRARSAQDVRFIAAANQDLTELVAVGGFREDLLYRINVLPVHLPGLDQQRDQIPHWVRRMVSAAVVVDAEAMDLLVGAQWPGHLRQLNNLLVRALAISGTDTINANAVRQALAMEPAAIQGSVITAFDQLASAVLRYQGDAIFGQLIELSQSRVLFAAIWYRHLLDSGMNHDEAAAAMGKTAAMQSRNYQRELKRELMKLRELHDLLGIPVPHALHHS